MLISESYKNLNEELHTLNPNYGVSGSRYADRVRIIADEINAASVLDYGCGKGTLAQSIGFPIFEYDPAVQWKQSRPEPADLVVCTDVLEHIEPELIDEVIHDLYSLTKKRLFFSIALTKAQKTLSDGRNAHLIVENVEWWKKKLSAKFSIITTHTDEFSFIGEAKPLCEIKNFDTIPALSDDERNANVMANRKKVSARLSETIEPHGRKAVLVCYGPSLQQTWPAIYTAQQNGADIITVSGAHRFLIGINIIPTIHIDCDPRQRKAIQFGKPHQGVKYWMGSCVDPLYMEILEGHDVSLWHGHYGDATEKCVWGFEPDAALLVGGGSVGLRAISLLYSQGYRDFEIHGMDCSFQSEKETHAGVHLAPTPRVLTVICGDRSFLTSGSFISYAKQFNDDMRLWPNATFRLHGDGLLQHMQRSSA